MGNGLNRIGNTAALPIRAGGTVAVTSLDLANTLLYNLPKESYEVLSDTTKRVKDVLLGAWNHGKWYHKAMNIPLSPIIAGGTVLEGAVRSTVQPIINGVVNTWNTGKNFFKNTFRNIGRTFSKKPISDFSYDHLKTRPLTLNNWFSKLQIARGKSGGGENKQAAIVPIKKESEKIEQKPEEKIEKEKSSEPAQTDKEKTKETKGDEKEVKVDKEEKKTEKSKEDKNKEVGYKKAEVILKDSKHGSKIFENIRTRIPDLEFVFDESSSVGSVKKDTNQLTVGMKMPSDDKQIAPLNTKKNVKEQVKHVLLHEMGHIMIDDNRGIADNATKILEGFFNKDKNTISPIAQLDIYKTAQDKAREDLSEMVALYANKHEDLDKYLGKLTSDKKEDEEYRKKFKLAKISKEDADVIKDTCEKLVEEYSKGKVVKMDTRAVNEESKMAA